MRLIVAYLNGFFSLLLAILAPSISAIDLKSHDLPTLDRLRTNTIDNAKWIIIKSRQTTSLYGQQADGDDSTWQVEDVFAPDEDVSYSLHSNLRTGQRYSLMSTGGRTFFVQTHALGEPQGACRLDHRQDHSTLFPWRNVTKMEELESQVIGLGAIWMNSEGRSQCSRLDDRTLLCTWYDKASMSEVQLRFTSTGLRYPSEIVVRQEQTIHRLNSRLENSQLLSINVRAKVESLSVMSNLPDNLDEEIERLLVECKNSLLGRDYSFPSLIKRLVESPERYYSFSYEVKTYGAIKEMGEGAPVEESYTVNEDFSHSKATQLLIVSASDFGPSEWYYRMLAHRYVGGAWPATEEVCFKYLQYRVLESTCEPSQFTSPLKSLSSLMQRNVLFGRQKSNEHSNEEHFSGILIGLGALLMNAADVQDKRLSSSAVQSSGQEASAAISWFVDDTDNGLTFEFKFKGESSNTEPDIEDLIGVQVRRLVRHEVSHHPVALGGLDSDEVFASEQFEGPLLLSLKIESFFTSSGLELLDTLFAPNEVCPFKQQLESGEIVPSEAINLDNEYKELDEQLTTEDQEDLRGLQLEFPTLEQYLNLETNFVLTSDWSLHDDREFAVREVLLRDGQASKLEAKLEVKQLNPTAGNEYFYFFDYGAEVVRRVQGDECVDPENRLDGWLDELSSKGVYGRMKLAGLSNLKQYGVAGLWKLAGDSGNYVKFSRRDEHFAIWRLEDHPDLLNINLEYHFRLLDLKHPNMRRRIKLTSIFICPKNDAAVETTMISMIDMKPDHAQASDFNLPETCFMMEASTEIEDWSRFLHLYSENFKEVPSKEVFQFHYDLTIVAPNFRHTFEAFEAKEKLGGAKLTLVQGNMAYTLLTTNEGKRILQENLFSDQCKVIQSAVDFLLARELFDLLMGDKRDDSATELSDSLLADLWYLFSLEAQKEQRNIKKRFRYLKQGDHYARATEFTIEGDQLSVGFYFLDRGTSRILDSIVLASRDFHQHPYELRIKINSIRDATDLKMKMSDRCSRELSSESFPELVSMLTSGVGIHMRTEKSLSKRGEKSEIQFSDEYLRAGQSYRVIARRTSTISTSDYLAFGQTQEFFDLSDAYDCHQIDNDGGPTIVGHDRDWIVDRLLLSLGLSEMSPLLLWQLAEQPGVAKKLALSGAGNELSLVDLLDWVKVGAWLKRRSWTVELADNKGEFELQFAREQGGGKQWVVLERVLLSQGEDRHEFDVINYDYLWEEGLSNEEHFRLPKGYGCKRHGLFEATTSKGGVDATMLDTRQSFEFLYEAYLSQLDGGGAAAADRFVSTGWFGYCPKGTLWSKQGALRVQVESRHFSDGQCESHRRVWQDAELLVSQLRELDLQSGRCSLRSVPKANAKVISLDFRSTKEPDGPLVLLDERLLDIVTMRDSDYKYHIIGRKKASADNNWSEERVYEVGLPELHLSKELRGAGSIVLTFNRRHPLEGRLNYLHTKFQAEFYLPKLRKKLTIGFRAANFNDCGQIVAKCESDQCHQSSEFAQTTGLKPRMRNFAMEFKVFGKLEQQFEPLRSEVEQLFTKELLGEDIGLDPMQVGKMQTTFDKRGQIVRIDLDLMEQPSAIERFARLDDQMYDDTQSGVERHLESRESCSSWCDSKGDSCQALTYCDTEHRCLLFRDDPSKLKFQARSGCSSFYKQFPAASAFVSLDETILRISRQVEKDESSLDLSVSDQQGQYLYFRPSAFRETTYDPMGGNEKSGYVITKQDYVLTRGEQLHTQSRAQCLHLCSSRKLLLCSHCQDTATCWLPQLDKGSVWQHFNESLVASEPKESCVLWAVDFEAEFQRFDRTRPPKTQLLKLDRIRLAECAAACRLGHQDQLDCLSFDYCASSASCHLQSTHVVMDLFDESIMDGTSSEQQTCTHFSRHLAADYRRQVDTRFKRHQSLALGGTTFETCALLCRRGEACAAFEYCEHKRLCYIERMDLSAELGEVEPMLGCSIYLPIHLEEELSIGPQDFVNGTGQAFVGQQPRAINGGTLVVECCWIAAALMAGLMGQICWITLRAIARG